MIYWGNIDDIESQQQRTIQQEIGMEPTNIVAADVSNNKVEAAVVIVEAGEETY